MSARRLLAITLVAASVSPRLGASSDAPRPSALETHHYSIAVRVRPLVLFWITKADVGDAIVTREQAPDGSAYSLLIGSDPDRAPMHINRWGYVREETHGGRTRVVGLMTQSDEESVDEATASVRGQATGRHAFKAIEATTEGEQAISRVLTYPAPRDYTIHDLDAALDAVLRDGSNGRSRIVSVPAGTKGGFLAALVEAMHAPPSTPIPYVYDGRFYDLTRTRQSAKGSAVSAEFLIVSRQNGERTRFSMEYGARGELAGVPLKVSYQPRWWMQIELTLADGEGR
jgi:hypothetical protein